MNILYLGSNIVTTIIESIGILIVIYGVVMAMAKFLRKEFQIKDPHKKQRLKLEVLRFDLGYNLVLALEFILASDIIKTVMDPSWDDLGKLGALVVIRTVLSFFLSKEINLK